MTDPLTPEEFQQVIEAVDTIAKLDSFGGMLQRNPGVVAIFCWLMGFLLRELVIYSNIIADWLRKFLRVDGVRYGRRKDDKGPE